MEIINNTPMQTGYTLSPVPDGRDLLVIITKGTFMIPDEQKPSELAAAQLPLIETDIYPGEPGLSAPAYEYDFSPFKRHCDVLLHGSAYAPGGRPTSLVEVSLRLGSLQKSFAVIGDRCWESGNFTTQPGYPAIFEQMSLSYDRAFGGIDDFHSNRNKHTTFMKNPAGKGYHLQLKKSFIDGAPMPNTELLRDPVKMPNGDYMPMSLGPVSRSWTPRLQLAGTYDQAWVENQYPTPPKDFNTAYFQAAPLDQQIPYPQGGESVYLKNLTPEGETGFVLPTVDLPVTFINRQGHHIEKQAVIDTIVLQPDDRLFTITWRTYLPIDETILEVPQVLIGSNSTSH
ncbi:MAG: DUF2169 domain-containing protein [Candidatus Thiodiazotropha sp. L084R]